MAPTMENGADPKDHTVAEVNEHLKTADAVEVQRVLDAEKAGQNRATVQAPNTAANGTPAGDQRTDTEREADEQAAAAPAAAGGTSDSPLPTGDNAPADRTDKNGETLNAGAPVPAEAAQQTDPSKPTWYEETNGPVDPAVADQYNVVPAPDRSGVIYSDAERAAQKGSTAGTASTTATGTDASPAGGASQQGGQQ